MNGRSDGAAVGEEPVVALLRAEWATIATLLAGLAPEEWSGPALPGWDVHDVVAHLIGSERMLSGVDRPATPADVDGRGYVHNEVAQWNEAWTDELRTTPPDQMIAAFRDVTGQRLASLAAMPTAELDAPSWTPAGPGTYRRFMEIRVFDCWMHEQDIRVATGRPGHEDGPVVEQALAEVVGALGYIVGKRAGAPDGATVTIHLTGPLERALHVQVQGRARVVDTLEGPADATVSLGSSLFFRLAGGRTDPEAALAHVQLRGDPNLARQVATHLGYTI